MIVAKTLSDFKSYLENNFNTFIQKIAVEWEKTISNVSLYQIGWDDPYALKKYNSVMIVPDQTRIDQEALLMITPVDVVMVIRGKDPQDVTNHQLAYQDALLEMLFADPGLGGTVWAAEINTVDIFAPVGGNLQIGVIVANIQIEQSFLGRN
jgi:hypothetical protein